MGSVGSDLDSADAAPVSQEVSNLQLPSEFSDKYNVLASVGKGGFGSVYKVRDIRTKAVYAVKVLALNESNQREVTTTQYIIERSSLRLAF